MRCKMRKAVLYIIACIMIITNCAWFTSCDRNESIGNDSDISQKYRDDFYTAVNESWLNDTKLEKGENYVLNSTLALKDIKSFLNDYIKKTVEKSDGKTVDEEKISVLWSQLNDMKINDDDIKRINGYIEKIESVTDLDSLNKIYCDKNIGLYNKLLTFDVIAMPANNKYVLNLSGSVFTQSQDVLQALFEFAGFDSDTSVKKAKNAVELCSEDVLTTSFSSIIAGESSVKSADSGFLDNIDLEAVLFSLGYSKDNMDIYCADTYTEYLNQTITEENLEKLKDNLEACVLVKSVCGFKSEHVKEIVKGENADAEQLYFDIVLECFDNLFTKYYIEKNISDEDVEYIKNMAQDIIGVYKNRIDGIDWMSDKAKQKAKKKLDYITITVARPKKYFDYSKLELPDDEHGGTLVTNIESCIKNNHKNNIEQLSWEYSKDDLIFNPKTINCFYNRGTNNINIYAGMMTSPYYDPKGNFEENLGGIGTVIAHEISHSLDIEGIEYDENGNYSSWLGSDDKKKYVEKAVKIKQYFNKISVPVPGVAEGINIDGKKTQAENMSDLNAVFCCTDILRSKKNSDYKAFFESYAKIYREKYTPQALQFVLKNSDHAIGKYRVNVPLSQIEEFYKAYDIKEGDGMYIKEEDRLSVW